MHRISSGVISNFVLHLKWTKNIGSFLETIIYTVFNGICAGLAIVRPASSEAYWCYPGDGSIDISKLYNVMISVVDDMWEWIAWIYL